MSTSPIYIPEELIETLPSNRVGRECNAENLDACTEHWVHYVPIIDAELPE